MSALGTALLYVLAFIGALVALAFVVIGALDTLHVRRQKRIAERWLAGDDEVVS